MYQIYNQHNLDKTKKPVNDNLTKQIQKSPNVFRMFFSSNDILGSSTKSQPAFAIDTAQLKYFDPNRPIFCTLDFFSNSSNSPPALYNLVWINGPFSNSTWYTNNALKNILGVFQGNGNNFYTRPLPYVLNQQDLLNNGVWQFAYYTDTHTLVSTTSVMNVIFAISFYQDP